MSFFDEIKRRNVFRVAIACVILSWVTAQVAELLLDAFDTPAWVLKTLLMVFMIGFPFALFFAWAFELMQGRDCKLSGDRRSYHWIQN